MLKEAATRAAAWARLRLALAPEDLLPVINVRGTLDVEFRYSRRHLLFMIQELLEHAIERTMRRHAQRKAMMAANSDGAGSDAGAAGNVPPPIEVVLSETNKEVVVKVSDQGGGTHRAGLEAVWSYHHEYHRLWAEYDATMRAAASASAAGAGAVAAPKGGRLIGHPETLLSASLVRLCRDYREHEDAAAAADPAAAAAVEAAAAESLMLTADSATGTGIPELPAWCGFGLPIARMVARYLEGDLRLASIDGYGTDAYLYVKKMAAAGVEPTPESFNFTPAEHAYV